MRGGAIAVVGLVLGSATASDAAADTMKITQAGNWTWTMASWMTAATFPPSM